MLYYVYLQCSFLHREEGLPIKRRKDNKNRVLEKGESQRKDGSYMYRYSDISGKRRAVYANDLSELRKKERQISRDLEENIDTVGAEITLNEQFDKCISLKTQLRNSTRQNYIGLWEGNLRDNALGKKRLCDIKKSDILRFYNSLAERGLKYTTIKAFDCMISPCFELAVDDNVLRKNPCKGCLDGFKKDADRRMALTLKEQEALLGFIRQSSVYSVHYPLVMFMIGTAVRCGEAIGLTWDDVDFKDKTINIDHQLVYKKYEGGYRFYVERPKTESGIRIIPMTADVHKVLIEQRRNQMSKGWMTDVEIGGCRDFVFSTKNRRPVMPSSINNMLCNVVNRYNVTEEREIRLPHISAHNLRHTGCTRMAEAGVDPKVMQYLMGHSQISVTMDIYNHVSTERIRGEIDKLEQRAQSR